MAVDGIGSSSISAPKLGGTNSFGSGLGKTDTPSTPGGPQLASLGKPVGGTDAKSPLDSLRSDGPKLQELLKEETATPGRSYLNNEPNKHIFGTNIKDLENTGDGLRLSGYATGMQPATQGGHNHVDQKGWDNFYTDGRSTSHSWVGSFDNKANNTDIYKVDVGNLKHQGDHLKIEDTRVGDATIQGNNIKGNLSGLPDGNNVEFSGNRHNIDYVGGRGNNVVSIGENRDSTYRLAGTEGYDNKLYLDGANTDWKFNSLEGGAYRGTNSVLNSTVDFKNFGEVGLNSGALSPEGKPLYDIYTPQDLIQ